MDENDDISDALAAARFVSNSEKEKGERGLVKMYRDLQINTPLKFLGELRALERDYLSAKGKTSLCDSDDSMDTDEGAARALALAENWLSEMQATQEKEDAERAARPNAAETENTLQARLAESLEREQRLIERVKELTRNGSGKASA